jgi:hypothetical protein
MEAHCRILRPWKGIMVVVAQVLAMLDTLNVIWVVDDVDTTKYIDLFAQTSVQDGLRRDKEGGSETLGLLSHQLFSVLE